MDDKNRNLIDLPDWDRKPIYKDVVMSDKFLAMGMGSKCLYFLLSIQADDYGFVAAEPKTLARLSGVSDDDLRALIAKGFVIPVPNSIYVQVVHYV